MKSLSHSIQSCCRAQSAVSLVPRLWGRRESLGWRL